MSKLKHEQLYRGKESMTKLAQADLVILGAGALGSNLCVNLVASGLRKIFVIDKDRVEDHNVSTQVYSMEDVGALKAEILRNLIYRELGEEIQAKSDELNAKNIGKVLKNAALVVDCFDNSASRKLVYEYCKEKKIDCLHTGVNESYGEIKWNENYRVPGDAGLDICDYPLARNLILLVVAVASESLVDFVLKGEKRNYSITLADLQINREID